MLKDRLERSGLPEALFFVITSSASPSSDLEKTAEDEIEREAWQGVAPVEAMELSSGLLPVESLDKVISPDIFVIEDTDELGIWKELRGSRDQVLVIDRCGKLAYQVIVPWSILHFPYVKAAILSTISGDPCGPCDAYADVVELNNPTNDLELTTEINTATNFPDYSLVSQDNNKNEDENNAAELPSLRIIMHAPHYHVNSDPDKNHEYLVMELDKPDYHGHLDVATYETADPNNESKNSAEKMAKTWLHSIAFGNDESPGLYGEVADYWRDGGEAVKIEQVVFSGDGGTEQEAISVTPPGDFTDFTDSTETVTSFVHVTVEEEASRSRLIAHYSRLLPWIYYILDK